MIFALILNIWLTCWPIWKSAFRTSFCPPFDSLASGCGGKGQKKEIKTTKNADWMHNVELVDFLKSVILS